MELGGQPPAECRLTGSGATGEDYQQGLSHERQPNFPDVAVACPPVSGLRKRIATGLAVCVVSPCLLAGCGSSAPADKAEIRFVAQRYAVALRAQDWTKACPLSTGEWKALCESLKRFLPPSAPGGMSHWAVQSQVVAPGGKGGTGAGADISSDQIAGPLRQIDKVVVAGDTATVSFANQQPGLKLRHTARGWLVSAIN